jgi:inositol-phosphate phosphatase/L-galactose 1-phosphate phosphatase
MADYTEYYDFALKLAAEAGDLIRAGYNDDSKKVDFKLDVDLVTETDKKTEQFLMNAIKAKYPDHLFIGEETVSATHGSEELTEKPTWLIDPIDGTTNFVHRFPFTCVSIGFAINKVPVVGVVFNPIINELFSAAKGKGAFLNGKQIHVSKTENLKQALIGTGFSVNRDTQTLDKTVDGLRKMLENCREVRRAGSAALDMCYVAKGTYDIFYQPQGVHSWDVAAGIIIVQEAGGVAVHPTVESSDAVNPAAGGVLCGNHELSTKFFALVNQK